MRRAQLHSNAVFSWWQGLASGAMQRTCHLVCRYVHFCLLALQVSIDRHNISVCRCAESPCALQVLVCRYAANLCLQVRCKSLFSGALQIPVRCKSLFAGALQVPVCTHAANPCLQVRCKSRLQARCKSLFAGALQSLLGDVQPIGQPRVHGTSDWMSMCFNTGMCACQCQWGGMPPGCKHPQAPGPGLRRPRQGGATRA